MKQESLLPFILKGVVDCSEINKNTDVYEVREPIKIIKGIAGSCLKAMYSIPKNHINVEELARHKRNLTMIPQDASFSNQAPVQFEAFEEKNGIFYVPRFYGIEHWGNPEKDMTSDGEEMRCCQFNGSLNSIQQDACDTTLERINGPKKGGLLVLPCGYGKTVCSLYIASKIKRKVLVLVHKAFLVEQWQERAKTFIPGCTVGKIQQNTVQIEADIVIGMVQSLSKREYGDDVMKRFGLVIVDESHHMAAQVFHKALRQIPAKKIVALSATPDRKDGLTCLLYWSMGSICYKIERQPEHTLVSCVLYEGGKRKEIKYRDGRISMPLMTNALIEDDERNELIAKRMKYCYDNYRYIIVLSDRIKQLHKLYILLTNMGVSSLDIGYYIGTSSVNERAVSSNSRIILSTYSMAKEGLDIPRLDTLILATPKGDIVQASGRIQRKHSEKKIPLIIDVVDTYSVFEKLRWKRWGFYRKEGFMCQTYDSNSEDGKWFC